MGRLMIRMLEFPMVVQMIWRHGMLANIAKCAPPPPERLTPSIP